MKPLKLSIRNTFFNQMTKRRPLEILPLALNIRPKVKNLSDTKVISKYLGKTKIQIIHNTKKTMKRIST